MNEIFDRMTVAIIENITAQEQQGVAHHDAVFNCFEAYKLHMDNYNIGEQNQINLMKQLESELHAYYGSVKQ